MLFWVFLALPSLVSVGNISNHHCCFYSVVLVVLMGVVWCQIAGNWQQNNDQPILEDIKSRNQEHAELQLVLRELHHLSSEMLYLRKRLNDIDHSNRARYRDGDDDDDDDEDSDRDHSGENNGLSHRRKSSGARKLDKSSAHRRSSDDSTERTEKCSEKSANLPSSNPSHRQQTLPPGSSRPRTPTSPSPSSSTPPPTASTPPPTANASACISAPSAAIDLSSRISGADDHQTPQKLVQYVPGIAEKSFRHSPGSDQKQQLQQREPSKVGLMKRAASEYYDQAKNDSDDSDVEDSKIRRNFIEDKAPLEAEFDVESQVHVQKKSSVDHKSSNSKSNSKIIPAIAAIESDQN